MKEPRFPDTLHYVFEMTVGINSELVLPPGEISSLLIDGLIALDDQGLLFPGVTVPEDRLRLVGMDSIGYERSRRGGPVDDAYKAMIVSRDQLPKGKRELSVRLDTALDTLDAVMQQQRMVAAKLKGLWDRCYHPADLDEGHRKSAEALLAAAKAIAAAVKAATKPVL